MYISVLKWSPCLEYVSVSLFCWKFSFSTCTHRTCDRAYVRYRTFPIVANFRYFKLLPINIKLIWLFFPSFSFCTFQVQWLSRQYLTSTRTTGISTQETGASFEGEVFPGSSDRSCSRRKKWVEKSNSRKFDKIFLSSLLPFSFNSVPTMPQFIFIFYCISPLPCVHSAIGLSSNTQ